MAKGTDACWFVGTGYQLESSINGQGLWKKKELKTGDQKFWEKSMWVDISEWVQSMMTFVYHVDAH